MQNVQVEFHTATPSPYPLGRVFVDFMGPLTKTKCGIEVELVVMDSFSKFVQFFPVGRLTSREIATCWKRDFSPKSTVSPSSCNFSL